MILSHHHASGFLAVHETLGYDGGCEDLVSLTELLEENSVWETKPADSNTFQHSVATQLIQD